MTPTTTELVLVVDSATRTEALSWPERARLWKVEDDRTVVGASELLKGIKALQGKIGDTFDSHIKRAHEAHKALLKEKADLVAPLAEAETILKRSLVAYETAQEQVRQQRERELQAQARREEEERRLADAVALTEEAKATGDNSLTVAADALLDEPFPTMAVSVPRMVPKVAGVVYKDTWGADPTVDVLTLAKAVAEGRAPLYYLKADLPRINSDIRNSKGTRQIPGVKILKGRVVAASS